MNPQDRTVGLFIMGGTIDSRNAPERDGEAVVLRTSLVGKYLENLQLYFTIIVRNICMKDSRGIFPEDRERLRDEIKQLGLRNNLVTHGTYTMKNTGEYLLAQEAIRDRVIGLTGSMGTLLGTVDEEGRLMPSDGQFNLGYSFGQLSHLDIGVYQFMNGGTFKLPEEWWMHDEKGISWKKGGKVLRTSKPGNQ
ncbi:MAG: asparaginase domain-containing protein [Candidatus Peregrinibacteria bacterium]